MNRLTGTLIRSAATIIIVILAVIVAVWMWNHYERSPWTRDGRVRAGGQPLAQPGLIALPGLQRGDVLAGLALRDPARAPLQVMACENAIGATNLLHDEIRAQAGEAWDGLAARAVAWRE